MEMVAVAANVDQKMSDKVNEIEPSPNLRSENELSDEVRTLIAQLYNIEASAVTVAQRDKLVNEFRKNLLAENDGKTKWNLSRYFKQDTRSQRLRLHLNLT